MLGEGAGVLVLEELAHAKARGARIYCELTGYGMSADAHHITAPPENGDGARRSMLNALRNAQHAARPTSTTSTRTARRRRSATSRSASRSSARSATTRSKLAVSSTKSMTGHLLGAAGGIEAVFTVLAMRDQVAPPTINLVNVDPACDLDFVPLTARKMKIAGALSNSFGFGGTNATLAFRALS